ncbi:DEAD/DEAH box helicase [Pedobacter helvus]|uniref:DEAD/DEAH box helicase n=1 Tax=Pedobacter helvus TaxID=2563444 RepID=A0ABW9JFU4_9SPHI|nr:type ISP restriction/modification enzyme [Pedobacter ureilyticus]
MSNSFRFILDKYRKNSFSQKDKGERFERLMKAYLLTDPKYSHKFKKIWLWEEFPGKKDLGSNDTGIDLVALTKEGDYWAIQCKCYQESSIIDKPSVDSFLSTSSRHFKGEDLRTYSFSHRLWISTTNKWGINAQEAIKNQNPPVSRINLFNLIEAPLDWGKLDDGITGEVARTNKKTLRTHQTEALTKTNEHFKANDRGKLIMACGTGKTFNSLRIAENETKGKGLILFLVPSIALLGQTLNEWYADALEPINAICICSDPEITKNRRQLEDIDTSSVVDLAFPASTNVESILHQFKGLETKSNDGLTVVFSTYQSIEVISKAQKALEKEYPKYGEFDLIICDEAHRTTGVSLAGEDESSFTKVHNNDFIKAKKRLYMTATPRLYNDDTKSKAAQAEAYLCSMDDVSLYGEEIYRIGFGEAVEKDLLTDYKVLILTLNENDVPPAVQKMIMDKESEINTDDASKLIGCINALSKQILGDLGIIKDTDPEPMRRAVAFCQSIKASQKITNTFNVGSEGYISELPIEKQDTMQMVASKHIDGTMNATDRNELLSWLKDEPNERECRVLTNVRCLSEGVDVPSLDAVLFLSARNSQVDVVQSVGRVMRKSQGKKYGYIIIPIVVPSDVDGDKALDDNERYKVVWTVLNALRAHDDRFSATVSQIELNKNKPQQILVGRPEISFDKDGNPIYPTDSDNGASSKTISAQISLQFEQLQNIVFAKMVQKVGEKGYWEQWAKSVADIATKQTLRITKLITEDEKHQKTFDEFLKGLHKNINPSITQNEAIEMLSQHIITKPVFDALFENYSFVHNNPMSKSMQNMLDLLEDGNFEKETETLQKFYESVKRKASGIDNAEGKQKIIIELYDKFFKTAFPKMVEKLGIVYTPIEVVDFIIHSVNDILIKEFGRSLSDENVHVLDPFTGTGTFITRLLQSGLINKEDLLRKYTDEIHCNEIVLLAYYIAAVNIENAFHDLFGKDAAYQAFEGICLTDTFQLAESKDAEKLFSEVFPQNSKRVQRQQKAPLRIIMGNPPYSIGQKSANDNAQNQSYPTLDSRIAHTYAKLSTAGLNKSLYDAYIKAFRWSADRLDNTGGIICFVTNNGWIEKQSMDGFRKSIENEFSSIYVFNLRGSIRGRSGISAKKEGQNVFDIMTGVAITLLVKNPNNKSEKALIHYHDIGDFLNRKEKISLISSFKSFANESLKLRALFPDVNGDWVSMRNSEFENFIPLEPLKKFDLKSQSVFNTYAIGVATNRDAWVYNYSKRNLIENLSRMLSFYNNQISILKTTSKKTDAVVTEDLFTDNGRNISWTVNLKKDLLNAKEHKFNSDSIVTGLYRPFCKTNLYYNKSLVERPGLFSQLFPSSDNRNLVICLSGIGDRKGFSALMTDAIPNLDTIEKAQCFPLYYYEINTSIQKGLFDESDKQSFTRREAVSDFILQIGKKQYGNNLTKEDIFYYVYGLLHSREYVEQFANDLKKMLPRLPLVENVRDFWKFTKAGRALADLHLNYESYPSDPEILVMTAIGQTTDYKVSKMRFPANHKIDKRDIIYNDQIIIQNIPSKAYEYVINGKSAIEWIMERYQVKIDLNAKGEGSGIKNDPNEWADEVGNSRYILDLLLSIINVSIQTVDIVNNLPKVNFDTGTSNIDAVKLYPKPEDNENYSAVAEPE